MAKVKIVSDRLNTFFTNNRIATGTAAPTSGTWKVGDIVISTTQSGVIGWVCTIAGTPGTWKTIQSKEDLSAAFAAKTHTHNYAGSSSAGGAATSALACTGNAATATKLQTARTINGTSFDGTTAITTANWGTARTLTIGNTGKSVNGSGNVSWSLAEIGAFGKQGEVTASTNWNTLLTPGVYKVQISEWGATSLGGPNSFMPGIYSYGMLFIYQSNISTETRTVQTYYPYSNDNSHPILTRMYNGSTWKTWSKIGRGLTHSDVGAAASSHTHNYAGSSSAGGAANSALACTGNAATATKLQTARTINGTAFDGTQNITIPITPHNHDSNYLKTNGDSGFWGNLLIDTSSSESKFKTTTGEGFFFNRIRLGMYDWTKDSEILAYKHETGELTLGSSIVTTKVNGPFYGANNIALNRGSVFIQSLAGNATCDYLRFGTNILASNDSKQTYLIDMVGNRANLDVGHLTANSVRLTNGGYPALQFSNNVRIEYDAAGDALYAAGTKSSSSGFREFRAAKCNSTENAIIAGKKLFIQSGAPSGVSAGDVWIQV